MTDFKGKEGAKETGLDVQVIVSPLLSNKTSVGKRNIPNGCYSSQLNYSGDS